MKITHCISIIIFVSCIPSKAQVPVIGDSLKLEIANWNLEWFGKAGYGPSDEALQQTNVLNVIQKSDIDIWTFCEVSNNAAFDSMMIQLPDYGYTICNYFPEQKTAVIFKKSQFKFIKSELLGTNNPDSFTTRRFPFLVVLKPIIPMGIDTLHLIALHLKANFGTTAEKLSAYNSRLRSGEWLQMYLNKYQVNRHCMVLGDWNDDLDESIYNALPSPYAAMQETDFKFNFITRKFTDNHQGTTTSYPDAIDHQLISYPLQNYLIQNSTSLFYLNQYINSYSSTTSDHYPVYSKFNRNSSSIYNIRLNNSLTLYPNPTDESFSIHLQGPSNHSIIKMINMNGQCLLEKKYQANEIISVAYLPSGCYQVILTDGDKIQSKILQVNH